MTLKPVTIVKALAASKPERKDGTDLVAVTEADGIPEIVLSDQMQKLIRPYLRALGDVGGMKAAGAHAALDCIRYLVLALQSRTSVHEFRRLGGHEAIDFLQCLETGKTHAVLEMWQQNRPGKTEASPRILALRKVPVIGILALLNLGLKKTDAFTMAALAVTKAKVLGNCERETVRNWYRQSKADPWVTERVAGLIDLKSPAEVRAWITDKIIALGQSPTDAPNLG